MGRVVSVFVYGLGFRILVRVEVLFSVVIVVGCSRVLYFFVVAVRVGVVFMFVV